MIDAGEIRLRPRALLLRRQIRARTQARQAP
jgi:hypothetical protein